MITLPMMNKSNSQKAVKRMVMATDTHKMALLCSSWPMKTVARVKPTFGKMNAVVASQYMIDTESLEMEVLAPPCVILVLQVSIVSSRRGCARRCTYVGHARLKLASLRTAKCLSSCH